MSRNQTKWTPWSQIGAEEPLRGLRWGTSRNPLARIPIRVDVPILWFTLSMYSVGFKSTATVFLIKWRSVEYRCLKRFIRVLDTISVGYLKEGFYVIIGTESNETLSGSVLAVVLQFLEALLLVWRAVVGGLGWFALMKWQCALEPSTLRVSALRSPL